MTKMVKIDGQRLAKAIEKRNLKITHASKEMGFGSTYLTDCVARGCIPEYSMVLINKLFNITLEEIQPIVEKVVEQTKETPSTDTTELNEKMDKMISLLTELNSNITKLGNISMQNMEYILKIKNTVAGGDRNVKCG